MDLDKIFTDKLYSIRRKIYSTEHDSLIGEELEHLYSWLEGSFSGLELFKRLGQVADELLAARVVANESYCCGFLKHFLNYYFARVEADPYDSWALVLTRLLPGEKLVEYPALYGAFLKLYRDRLPLGHDIGELSFPLADEFDLFGLLKAWLPFIEEQLGNSSSYTLLFDPILRNPLVLFLYKQFLDRGRLNIWMPFAGCGVEPLLISYILHLIHEVESGEKRVKGLNILCSDHSHELLKRGLATPPFDLLLSKTKEDFAVENGLKLKEIGVSRSGAAKALKLLEGDPLADGELPANPFELVVINSLKLARDGSVGESMTAIFEKLKGHKQPLKVIVEVESEFEPELNSFRPLGLKASQLLSSRFIGERRDYFLSYLLYELTPEVSEKAAPAKEELAELYRVGPMLDQKELKQRLEMLDKSEFSESEEWLHYASLLARAKQFKKSYELIRDYYEADINLAYKILKAIIRYCKNEKIVKRVSTFIVEKQIKERGFSAELLDAISGEIDRFCSENEDFDLEDIEGMDDEAAWL